MHVIKRDGERQPVHFDKITERIQRLCTGLPGVDAALVAQKIINGMFDGVTTTQLDILAAETGGYAPLSGTRAHARARAHASLPVKSGFVCWVFFNCMQPRTWQ